MKALRRGLAAAKGKRAAVRVVETRCLGVCPRYAATMVDGKSPTAALIVARGTDVETHADRVELQLAEPK